MLAGVQAVFHVIHLDPVTYYMDTVPVNFSVGYVILLNLGVITVTVLMLINVSDLAAMSEGFEQSQQMLFSGPLAAQIIGIGVIIPICEELIYRGLIFMRLRQYCNVNLAIGISALLFAAFHGNIVQGIYAFVTGILFAYVYEKYAVSWTCMSELYF